MNDRGGTLPIAPQEFTATIYRVGINFCVDLPRRVDSTFGQRGYVPVVLVIDGESACTTLTPRGGGRHRLFINGKVRAAAGIGDGDRVAVSLRIDLESREPPVPDDLMSALGRSCGAVARFQAFTPTHRRGILTSIADAKRDETRARRIDRAVDHVLEGLGHEQD